jgi:hypothetical protein
MKVYIGPYKNFYGPHQFCDWLEGVGVSEKYTDKLADYLSNTWISPFCQWIYDKRGDRVKKVKIHGYDTWNMDGTLSLIILPMLKQLQKDKQGSPLVDDEDVPEHLRSINAPPKENEWDCDDLVHERWNWVMDELIWTFEQLNNPDWDQQFYSGEHDSISVPIDIHGNEVSREEAVMFRHEKGPNDTFVIDYDGKQKVQDRINHGLKLFGKYYQGLWD